MASEVARALWVLRAAGSVDELTRRYKRLCKLFHPDLRQAGEREQYESHMQQINEAYSKALEKFNILTYRNPKGSKQHGSAPFHDELRDDPPPPASKTRKRRAKPKPDAGVLASVEAVRRLSSALAALQGTRTFFSLHAANDPREREQYKAALVDLEYLWRRFPRSTEGQDALYYMAVAHCNLRNFRQALSLFAEYRMRFPDDSRNGLFHFYAGICHHRLCGFTSAVREYGYFLLSQRSGKHRHFAALVATYKEAAEQNAIPRELPYG